MKVCKKVEEKGKTSYNEVADELVREFMEQKAETEFIQPTVEEKGKKAPHYDEKNIRRRYAGRGDDEERSAVHYSSLRSSWLAQRDCCAPLRFAPRCSQ